MRSASQNAVCHTDGLPERSVCDRRVGAGEIGMIEKVEQIRSKEKLQTFGDSECPPKRDIRFHEIERAQSIAA